MTAALIGLSAKLTAREACNQDDVTCLRTLLRIGKQQQHERSRSVNLHSNPAARKNITHSRATSTALATLPASKQHVQTLTEQQRYVLATETVNYALSTLNKPTSQASTLPSTAESHGSASTTSVAQPSDTCQEDHGTSEHSVSSHHQVEAIVKPSQLTAAELGHAAFEFLRNTDSLKPNPKTRSGLAQVIGGNLVFTGKLIALGHLELAERQLCGLHVHLKFAKPQSSMRLPATSSSRNPVLQDLPSLLALEPISIKDIDRAEHVSIFQSLVLRLIACKPTLRLLDDVLPFLDLSSQVCPINVLLQCSRGPKRSKRASAQLEALSKTLLFCARRLVLELKQESHAASTIVRLHTLSLCSRLAWITLSDHECDFHGEITIPFLQAIKEYLNASTDKPTQKYTLVQDLSREIDDFSNKHCRRSILRIIHDHTIRLLLGCLAYDANRTDEGLEMIEDVLSSEGNNTKDQGALVFMSLTRLGRQSFADALIAIDSDHCWAHLSSASAMLREGFSDENIAFETIVREAMQLRNAAFEHLRDILARATAEIEESQVQIVCCYDVINHFNIFLLRNLNLRAKENNMNAAKVLRQRQSLLFRIAKQSVQAIINMTRQVSRLSWFTYEAMQSALHVTGLILHRLRELQSQPGGESLPYLDLDALTTEFAKVNFQIVRTGDQSKVQLTVGLNFLKRGLLLLEPLSEAYKQEAQQALGFLRLGRMYSKLASKSDALNSYESCLQTCIISGLVAEAAHSAETIPFHVILTKDPRFQVLYSATKALLELELSGEHDVNDEWMIDLDGTQNIKLRATLLECRLTVFADWASARLSTRRAQQTISRTTKALKDCYDADEHPLRLRRVDAEIMRFAVDSQTSLGIVQREAPINRIQNLAEDTGLADYNSHICAIYNIAFGIHNPTIGIGHIVSAIDTWTSLVSAANSWDTVSAQIYNVEAWLVMLDVTADFLDMQGQDQQRLRCLTLLALIFAIAPDIQPTCRAARFFNVGRAVLEIGRPELAKAWIESAIVKLDGTTTEARTSIDQNIAVAHLSFLNQDIAKCANDLAILKNHLCDRRKTPSVLSSASRAHLPEQAQEILVTADAFFLCALVSEKKNQFVDTLLFLRRTVTLLNSLWRMLESKLGIETQDSDESSATIEVLTRRLSRMSLTPQKSASPKDERRIIPGPAFWPLIRRLFSALMQLGKVSKYVGALKAANSAWEQAQKVAVAAGAPLLQAQVLTEKADLAWRSGDEHEAKALYHHAETLSSGYSNSNMSSISGLLSLGDFHRYRKQWRNELDMYARVDSMIDALDSQSYLEEASRLFAVSQKLTARPSKPLRETHMANGSSKAIKPTQKSKRAGARPAHRVRKSGEHNAALVGTPQPTASLRQDVLTHRIESMLAQKNLVAASKFLQQLNENLGSSDRTINGLFLRATHLLQEALDSMAADAVYSMLPDSTLSLPNIPPSTRRRSSVSLASENDRAKHGIAEGLLDQASPLAQQEIAEKLRLAMTTIESTCTELGQCSNGTISGVQELMAACAMLLSFSGKLSRGYKSQSMQLANHLDFYKDIAVARDHMALRAEISNHAAGPSLDWPPEQLSAQPVTRAASLSTDENSLTRILPGAWSVVSLNLREHDEHLYLTRYEANEAPFVLRIPLNRQTGDDLDEECFSLSDAREELLDIVQKSDATVHKARDAPEAMKAKGAKTQWWEERDELNDRLRSLLMNMENIWFGGFRSIFSTRDVAHDGACRFYEAFNSILLRHLPSRRVNNKKNRTQPVALDVAILELFTGLMTCQKDDVADLDDALNDLLYFVVDILQYNGEPNAYDEIDFDSMIVDVQDALSDFRDSLGQPSASYENQKQLILVLDKQLHCFPWESMPCLENRSVSRMPSLLDIIDRIESMQAQDVAGAQGVIISAHKGTYMLNPGGDLPRTQTYFEKPLASLTLAGWNSFVGRVPSEQDFALALSRGANDRTRGVMVYIGHGSGAQYVRAKTIRRLRPHCNAALLFGCSSASLKEAGEFEAHGTPKNYLAAGAPAVLGSLWDVTDGDVDKFACGVLEGWGILPRGSCEENAQQQQNDKSKGKGRSRTRAKLKAKPKLEEQDTRPHDSNEKMSLSDAVARSRSHCYLRYLNGAAMVVYGVPVYLA